jgi:hypothetical protein
MKTILAAIGLLTLFALGTCGMTISAITTQSAPVYATDPPIWVTERPTKFSPPPAPRSPVDAYFEGQRELEAERRYHCWQEKNRNCTRDSRW